MKNWGNWKRRYEGVRLAMYSLKEATDKATRDLNHRDLIIDEAQTSGEACAGVGDDGDFNAADGWVEWPTADGDGGGDGLNKSFIIWHVYQRKRRTAALSSTSMMIAAEGAGVGALPTTSTRIAAEGAGAAPTLAVAMAMAKTRRVENIAVKLCFGRWSRNACLRGRVEAVEFYEKLGRLLYPQEPEISRGDIQLETC
jgi:hypothetical protein